VREERTIRETGTRDELMRLDGLYRKLYAVQRDMVPEGAADL
jgi:hypothetical protein